MGPGVFGTLVHDSKSGPALHNLYCPKPTGHWKALSEPTRVNPSEPFMTDKSTIMASFQQVGTKCSEPRLSE